MESVLIKLLFQLPSDYLHQNFPRILQYLLLYCKNKLYVMYSITIIDSLKLVDFYCEPYALFFTKTHPQSLLFLRPKSQQGFIMLGPKEISDIIMIIWILIIIHHSIPITKSLLSIFPFKSKGSGVLNHTLYSKRTHLQQLTNNMILNTYIFFKFSSSSSLKRRICLISIDKNTSIFSKNYQVRDYKRHVNDDWSSKSEKSSVCSVVYYNFTLRSILVFNKSLKV